jgi:hypothetical protein
MSSANRVVGLADLCLHCSYCASLTAILLVIGVMDLRAMAAPSALPMTAMLIGLAFSDRQTKAASGQQHQSDGVGSTSALSLEAVVGSSARN